MVTVFLSGLHRCSMKLHITKTVCPELISTIIYDKMLAFRVTLWRQLVKYIWLLVCLSHCCLLPWSFLWPFLRVNTPWSCKQAFKYSFSNNVAFCKTSKLSLLLRISVKPAEPQRCTIFCVICCAHYICLSEFVFTWKPPSMACEIH